MKTKALPILLILALAFATAGFAADSDKWIHIKVDDGEEQVMVNLPLTLVRAALAVIPAEIQEQANDEIELAFDELHLDGSELQEFWEAVKDAPEATFVSVRTKDEKIDVKKEGNFVLVKTTEVGENGTDINVKFPLAVIDGLLSGEPGTLNFEAAIEALAAEGDGHLVSIRDGDETVKIWIDDQNEAE
jgi:hypothetical protein